jgi:hypothetical protein
MWAQIVGKTKLQLSPFLNEWWHVAYHLTARGLTTGTIPAPDGVFQVDFDFVDHNLKIYASNGDMKLLPLFPRSVAEFYGEYMSALRSLGIDVELNTIPDEVDERIPFDQDDLHASYDRRYVERWWRTIVQTSTVLDQFRSTFVGKNSPIHFWWGSFDLNQTRFSGRLAPLPPTASRMMRIAEDQENFAAGFWAGSSRLGGPAFYTYMYPPPEGIETAEVLPAAARFDNGFGEFILPYGEVRAADDPEATILQFLESTYNACAEMAQWPRDQLEQPVPVPQRSLPPT